MGWVLWLLVSWLVNYTIDTPIRVRADTLTPAVRGMMQSMIVGLGLIWPAWRLSQGRTARMGAEIVTDLVGMLLVVQIVIWPFRLLVGWPIPHALLIDLVVIVWSVALGLCVWAGRIGGTALWRAGAMAACALLLTGGWLVTAVSGQMWSVRWSPMYMLWVMTDMAEDFNPEAILWRLLVVFGAGLALWVWMLAWSRRRTAANADRRL